MFRKPLFLQNLAKSIIIAEPVHFGDTHVQVNSAFAALFRYLYPHHHIQIIAEQTHIEALQLNAGDKIKGLTGQSFRQYSNSGPFYWPQKILGEWNQIVRIVLKVKKSKPELLVWLCVFPTGHALLQLLSKFFLRGQKQIIVLHGELEYLKPGQSSLPDRFLGRILRYALKRSGPDLSYIVLGDSIKSNLEQYPVIPTRKFNIIRHPFLYQQPPYNKEERISGPLKICTFGTLKKAKNAHLFFEMAQGFAAEIDKGLVSFSTIGKVSEELNKYKSPYVSCYKPDEFIGQKEYENEIRKHDLALFFYDEGLYQLSASGVLHECINLGIPFLSLNNNYFKYIVDQYAVGKLFMSVEEMAVYIRRWCLERDTRFESRFATSIFSFIEQNSFLLQAGRLKAVLEQQNLYIIS